MSWNKNTTNVSEVDAVIRVLKDLLIPYKVKVIGKFRGRGLNDDIYAEGKDKIYKLRRLQYVDKVILEYVNLDADCDVDDVIHSKTFDLKKEPKDWQAVNHIDMNNVIGVADD